MLVPAGPRLSVSYRLIESNGVEYVVGFDFNWEKVCCDYAPVMAN